MIAARRRLALATVLLLAPALAPAQTRISIPDSALEQQDAVDRERISIVGDANERERLREMLVEWRTYVQEGNVADASDVIGQMEQLMALEAVKDERTILSALVAAGNDWAATKSWDLAERAYKAALELDAGYGPAHVGMADMARRRDGGVRGHVSLLAGVVQATKARFASPVGVAVMAANLALIMLMAIAVGVAGTAVVLLAKTNRLLRHGVQEALGQRVPQGIDRIIAWGFLLLPMMLFLSPPWWVLWWLALLPGYAPPGLRRLGLLCLLVAALLPVGFHLTSRLAAIPQNPVVAATASLRAQDVTPRDITDIGALAQRHPTPQIEFLLARLESAAGRQDDAIDAYSKVIGLDANEGRAIVNRGNIHFRRGDIQQAIADYKLAVDRDADLALAWRNGSIAFAQSLQADIAQQWISRAQQLDRGAVQDWNSEAGADRVADADLSSAETVQLVRSSSGEGARAPWLSLVNPVSIAALAAFVFALWRTRRGLGILAAVACEKCGRAFCARCHAASRGTAYCTQCVHLYVKKDGVSPVVRAAKLREVERHVAINSVAVRVFNLLLPGAGSLYASRLISGTLTLLAWGAALAALLMPTFLVMDPQRLGSADMSVIFAAQLAVLVIVYLVALLQSLRHAG